MPASLLGRPDMKSHLVSHPYKPKSVYSRGAVRGCSPHGAEGAAAIFWAWTRPQHGTSLLAWPPGWGQDGARGGGALGWRWAEGCDLLVGDARRARLQLQLFHLDFSQLQGGEDPMGSSLVSSGPLQLHREERLARGGVGPLSSAERSSSLWSPSLVVEKEGGQTATPRIWEGWFPKQGLKTEIGRLKNPLVLCRRTFCKSLWKGNWKIRKRRLK